MVRSQRSESGAHLHYYGDESTPEFLAIGKRREPPALQTLAASVTIITMRDPQGSGTQKTCSARPS